MGAGVAGRHGEQVFARGVQTIGFRSLFWRGDPAVLDQHLPTVAIVGARKATPYGLHVARAFGRQLAHHGVTVVSGLAYGVDTEAHTGAVEMLNGKTVAVMAHGLNYCYPKRNEDLATRILAKGGLLVSEYPDSYPPLPHQFLDRNRIIAGLADVMVVVEATERSGSMGAVERALGFNLPVLAVPGEIGSRQSEGTNSLIAQGKATICLGVGDVLAALAGLEDAA